MNVISAIAVTDLYQQYAVGIDFLKHISFNIHVGQTVCIIGPNGAGKTTLLKCLCALLPIQRGKISIRINDHFEQIDPGYAGLCNGALRKRIGMVFQEPTLWPHLTVLQNVMAPLVDVHQVAPEEAREAAEHWLSTFRVEAKDWEGYPHRLSGGYARRVALARAFAIKPEILFLDEFTASLDPDIEEQTLRLLEKNFIEPNNKTVVMVTHKMELLSRWEPTVGLMQAGELIAFNDAAKVVDYPGPSVRPVLFPALGPSNAEWILARQCLRIARSLSEGILQHKATPSKMFQAVAEEISWLISQLEPGQSQLVLIVTAGDDATGGGHRIMAASQTDGFRLDGADAGKLPEPIRVLGPDGLTRIDGSHIPSGGVAFDTGTYIKGSLIHGVFTHEYPLKYQFTEYQEPINGVKNSYVPTMTSEGKVHYYEFSRATRNVYLFAMESQGEVIGVLSVDTTADSRWLPFVVKELKLIAELGAIAISVAHLGKGVGQGAADGG